MSSISTASPIRLAQALTLVARTLADTDGALFRVCGFVLNGADLAVTLQLTAVVEHEQPVGLRTVDVSSLDGWTLC